MSVIAAGIRDLFHVPGPGPYLMAHSAGAQPVAAAAALETHFLAPWREQGGGAWATWMPAIDAFRTALARLLHADSGEFCPQANVSQSFDRYLGSLPHPGARNRIVLHEDSFPSLGFVSTAAAMMGYEAQLIGGDPSDIASWQPYVDDRTAVVLAMHVHSNSGLMAPVGDLVSLAHDRGARCVVDIAQSVGVIPIDLGAWQADAVVGSCLKWLCGGPGAGFLWVRKDTLAGLKPRALGWFSHAEPWAMDIRDFRYAPDALRFWGATPDIAPFVAATAGIGTIGKIGVDAIRAHNRALQQQLRAALTPTTPHWHWPRDAVGGTLCIDVGTAQPAVAAALEAIGARADFRGTRLRLSFGAWNNTDEVELLSRTLASVG